jgi:hypothetical protein
MKFFWRNEKQNSLTLELRWQKNSKKQVFSETYEIKHILAISFYGKGEMEGNYPLASEASREVANFN